MVILDQQMRHWSARLRDEVKVAPPESEGLASTIAQEVLSLSFEAKQRVRDASLIPLTSRLEELRGFQEWMDLIHRSKPHPAVVRAQVITELYVCFVYLGEACFVVFTKSFQPGRQRGNAANFSPKILFGRYGMQWRIPTGITCRIFRA